MANALKEYLATLPPGEISDTTDLESLLAHSWTELAGSEGGMKPEKLYGRTERVVWEPPELHFTIERHGGTVLGSTRAELQNWVVNVESMRASLACSGHRQIIPMASAVHVEPIAEEIAELVVNRKPDDRLKWNADGSVRVLTGAIIPAARFKQTTSGRRKRFRASLMKRLAERGWKEIRINSYVSANSPLTENRSPLTAN